MRRLRGQVAAVASRGVSRESKRKSLRSGIRTTNTRKEGNHQKRREFKQIMKFSNIKSHKNNKQSW